MTVKGFISRILSEFYPLTAVDDDKRSMGTPFLKQLVTGGAQI